MKPQEQVEGWLKLKVLGAGSFGQIALWRNLKENYEVAVKVCNRTCEDLKEKQIEYWRKEVEIMHSLKHPNVVTAVKLPDVLQNALHSDLPILGMEYCSGGSLRRVMQKTINLCGFEERRARFILHDICEGLTYLHSLNIIHRDIKPENIVVQPHENRDIYKIIDLGYAKELLQTNHAESLVGTILYLAPEVFEGKKYDVTADYWSLGILAFEILSGIRPFFHNSTETIANFRHIRRKKKQVIFSKFLPDGRQEYFTTIPEWCAVSDKFKNTIVQWLQLLLAIQPKDRCQVEDPKLKPTSIDIMLTVLNEKIVRVFSASSASLLVFPKTTRDEELYARTMIPQTSRLILSSDCRLLSYEDLMGLSKADDGDTDAYLFDTNNPTSFKSAPLPSRIVGLLNTSPMGPLMWESRSHSFVHVHREFERLQQTKKAFTTLMDYIDAIFSKFSSKYQIILNIFREMKCVVLNLRRSRAYDQAEIGSAYHSSMDDLKRLHSTPLSFNSTEQLVAMQDFYHKAKEHRENLNDKLLMRDDDLNGESYKKLRVLIECSRGWKRDESKVPKNDEFIDTLKSFMNEMQGSFENLSMRITSAAKFSKELNMVIEDCDTLIGKSQKELTEFRELYHARDIAMWNVIKKILFEKKKDDSEEPTEASSIRSHEEIMDIVGESEHYRNELDQIAAELLKESSSRDEIFPKMDEDDLLM